MPTYEYVCTSCGYQFELVQNMSDPPRKQCPKCRKKVERKIGAGAGVIFKGSGFYATDYRSPEYKARQKADGGGAGTGAGKSAGGEGGKKAGEAGKSESGGGEKTGG